MARCGAASRAIASYSGGRRVSGRGWRLLFVYQQHLGSASRPRPFPSSGLPPAPLPRTPIRGGGGGPVAPPLPRGSASPCTAAPWAAVPRGCRLEPAPRRFSSHPSHQHCISGTHPACVSPQFYTFSSRCLKKYAELEPALPRYPDGRIVFSIFPPRSAFTLLPRTSLMIRAASSSVSGETFGVHVGQQSWGDLRLTRKSDPMKRGRGWGIQLC